ncbi:MAG: hypothetical protein ACTHKF_02250 [Candidatus Nitrosocosmicus sp.]
MLSILAALLFASCIDLQKAFIRFIREFRSQDSPNILIDLIKFRKVDAVTPHGELFLLENSEIH